MYEEKRRSCCGLHYPPKTRTKGLGRFLDERAHPGAWGESAPLRESYEGGAAGPARVAAGRQSDVERARPQARESSVMQPPGLARRLLQRALPIDAREHITNELDEVFQERCRHSGLALARLWYWREVLSFAGRFT